MKEPVRPGPPPVRSDSEWARAKVVDVVRRAALAGAAERWRQAAQLAAPWR